MSFPTDLEIAQQANIQPIKNIAEKINIKEDDLECYGRYKAKIPLAYIQPEKIKKSKLVLVSAINPTPAGEGKTTVSIGLSDGLNKIGEKSVVVLREPSLGPIFGIKGGAAGGGYAQVIPMVDINLHFTGDFAAIEKANNLLSALIDNNLQNPKNNLGIDPSTIVWKRVMDMNDRSLRQIVVGLGNGNGIVREEGFNITPASEVMAILCLSKDFEDLKQRLGNIFIGYTFDKKPIFARDLKAEGAMAILLKDAIKPNLVQTLEGNPAILHGGPFANIAQGTNSIIATQMGLSLSDYVVTEAGFGADLGAEKFLNIKSRYAGLNPDAYVIVATIRALRYHGGAKKLEYASPNIELVKKGIENLKKHIENAFKFGLKPIVALNHFATDAPEEIDFVQKECEKIGVKAILANEFTQGGEGMKDLAKAVVEIAKSGDCQFKPLYAAEDSVEQKIETIAKEIYGAEGVVYTAKAKKDLKIIDELGLNNLPVCMAKTQKSLSDDEKKIGRPTGFKVIVREFEFASGAGFIIPILGNIMRMPGLPSAPAAEGMDIDKYGNITGLS
ncbi:formate--tetrahydrofolate ligase [Riemerella columbipharyngis]|uniref:Formate--tetrahydrofolate ligase n=1 Tax=Riemerella columbipharyngis TaxID=1071918 RepID=A0A1G7AWY4_9FLAO|nr:formate--tetrahydrofolate ligase [Riemerella columbipharyngis]SDE19313.1 formate--tetrahydrofolate ligase [Riemerella columbipharyngis]